MSTFHFETTVPPDGMIPVVLPEELRGKTVEINVKRKRKPIPDSNVFWTKKSLDEIAAEQGGAKTCRDPESLSEGFPKLWDTPEELEDFLKRREY